jgi:hypothetical protein
VNEYPSGANVSRLSKRCPTRSFKSKGERRLERIREPAVRSGGGIKYASLSCELWAERSGNNWSRDQSIPLRSADFLIHQNYLHLDQQIGWWRWQWTVSNPRSRVAGLAARSPSRNGANTAACQSPCTISCGRKVKHLQHSRSAVIRQLRLKPTPLGRASARPKRMLKKRPEILHPTSPSI